LFIVDRFAIILRRMRRGFSKPCIYVKPVPSAESNVAARGALKIREYSAAPTKSVAQAGATSKFQNRRRARQSTDAQGPARSVA
jgi:hypothetical protein